MTRRHTPNLHDLVRELTETTQHRELYERRKKTRYHITNNAPLLVQLLRMTYPDGAQTEGAGNHPSSRPAANLAALDNLHRIHTETATWLRTLSLPDTGPTARLILRLNAATPAVDHCRRARPIRDHNQPRRPVICCTWHRIEADVRRWWTLARMATGWDLPPFRPANTCPVCGTRGTLRIRAIEKLATCTADECHSTWDETTIGILADHIRSENGEHQAAV